ncbi:uncharacterized protein YyaL (SSP411 family) [Microbacteriaceae bacterium SG_E_30_P1]|uniref:Uncharacterized protein YyaL (SSP411 family) n=1 Tax=Antiquaquibacter oligotrophicus TaxID=2880260 RepID=A0ABT6KJX5_9MICO|nr:DUF255 domain-containing protein [Antiquaquibacter oligotrophicus]MDH6180245.1 uncharacterized protein YyaL (SSP411 family) [Antiquaquibacter oligotrophicus]UDF14008.1 DUF255 domain-containing protein [Antiquaquibacter oligotrophicus]
MPNRLREAASPYLRSHADNPVDWWPWGPEPFEEAARRDVPVMVSIGYSTCHWCHVMARESFSDPEIAEYLNTNAVSIKVDREENVEVDASYLAAAGAFTPNLGWPLTVFVTPQGRAFFAGTYFPPQPVQGHPSFRQVLDAVFAAWRDRREEVERNGRAIVEALSQPREASTDLVTDFATVQSQLAQVEDHEFGGFGTAPKFPVAPVLRFLVDQGDALAERTLDAMASSALRDPVDGGFFRYSTQRDWSEPHYERMLYDNAQLLACYALLGRTEIADGIASFLIGTLQQPSGGFASAQDSESVVDGRRVEGFYYTLDAASRSRLEAPPLDGKILTGWNGLAIGALSLAGSLVGRSEWVDSARRAAEILLEHHVRADQLVHSSIDNTIARAPATLDDYGLLASGLIELARATGEVRYAVAARSLIDALRTDGEALQVPGGGDPVLAAQGVVVAPDPSDGALPSGPSAVASACLDLYELTGDRVYRDAAAMAVTPAVPIAASSPISAGAALAVMARLARPLHHVIVVTDSADAAAAARRDPATTSALSAAAALEFTSAGFELFAGRTTTPGATTTYDCEDFVCQLPVVTPDVA